MKIFKISFLAILVMLISCSTQPEEAKIFDEKMKETIAIHDEVMPKMGKISELISDLERKIDSTNGDQIRPAIAQLKKGHDDMMTWMKDFGDEFSKTEINQGIQLTQIDSLKARLKALETSKTQAIEMKKTVLEAIEKAESLLK